MEPKDRIIVALDVDELQKVQRLVESLAAYVGPFKVGLELLTSEGAPSVIHFVQAVCQHTRVFCDGKFMDIPNTVAGAVRAVTKMGVQMLNVHCLGGAAMMRAAKEAAVQAAQECGLPTPLVLGVTVLTSLSYDDLVALGLRTRLNWADLQEGASEERRELERLVCHLAGLAKQCGLDGVIASPQEVAGIRERCGPNFLIVPPGVRPEWAAAQDQKRVMTPGEAIKAGADYIVVGRPITKPPAGIGTPVDAAKRIADEIAAVRND